MVFDLPGGRVAVEYDSYYFHPDPYDDMSKTCDIQASGCADIVVRVREEPLVRLTSHDLMVPTRPDPQLCALLLVRHMRHLTEGSLFGDGDTEESCNLLHRLRFVDDLEREYVKRSGYSGFGGCEDCLAGLHDRHVSRRPTDLSLVTRVLGEWWL